MDRIDALKQFLREDPNDPFTRFALAQEYRQRGRIEDARQMFESLVRDQPEYVGTYYHLGKVLAELGEDTAAQETFREGINRAAAAGDQHARAELQSALLEAQGIGFD